MNERCTDISLARLQYQELSSSRCIGFRNDEQSSVQTIALAARMDDERRGPSSLLDMAAIHGNRKMIHMVALICGLFALTLGGARDMRAGLVACALVVGWIYWHYWGTLP